MPLSGSLGRLAPQILFLLEIFGAVDLALGVTLFENGERMAAVLISLFAFNVPAMLWQQAISPAFTAWRRIKCTRDLLEGRTIVEDPRQGAWLDRIKLWRWPRMTWPYDLITAANIAFLIFAPIPQVDIIRRLVRP